MEKIKANAKRSKPMITCNLAQILYQKDIQIQEISEELGISKKNLSKLYHNKANKIDLHALERLCGYLDISVGELLEYEPYLDVEDKQYQLQKSKTERN